jgi:hypothetical protein
MGILNFEKPKKVRTTEEHNTRYSSDSGVEGTYVPNMSEEDMKAWKGKHIKGDNERVEIRKTFSYNGNRRTYAQVLITVHKNGEVYMSTNGAIGIHATEFPNFNLAIQEALDIMKQ